VNQPAAEKRVKATAGEINDLKEILEDEKTVKEKTTNLLIFIENISYLLELVPAIAFSKPLSGQVEKGPFSTDDKIQRKHLLIIRNTLVTKVHISFNEELDNYD